MHFPNQIAHQRFDSHRYFIQNGALSAVPYICQAVSGFLAGQTADILRSKRVLNTTHTRKLYQVSCMKKSNNYCSPLKIHKLVSLQFWQLNATTTSRVFPVELGIILFALRKLLRPEKLRTYCYWRFCFSAFLGAGALLVAVGYSTCDKRDVAVVLLSLAVMFTGLCRAGYVVNHIDFAPR